MSRAVTFTQAQVRRAVKAAESAGLRVQSITIEPDGTVNADGPLLHRPDRFFELDRAAAYCRSRPDQFKAMIKVGIFPQHGPKKLWDRKLLDTSLKSATPEVRPGGGRVYFLAVDKFIKIGFSAGGTLGRVAQMQTGSPFEIVLIADVPGTEQAEQALHDKFKFLHERGEWFRRDAGLLAYIDWLQGK
jgi:hypothetical protein